MTDDPLQSSNSGGPRILFLSSHAQLGGAELWMERLIDELGPDRVDRLVMLAAGPFVDRMRARGLRVETLDAPGKAGVWRALRPLRVGVLAEVPDLVHANNPKAAIVATVALAGTGVPVVWVRQDFTRRRLGGAAGIRCAAIVCISHALRVDLPRRLHARTVVVSGGISAPPVDRTAAAADLRAAAGLPVDAEVVLAAGRLHPGKGQLDLVRAARAIREARPQAWIVLMGAPDHYVPAYERALRSAARTGGVEDAVRFLGHREDGPRMIAGADVLAAPSRPDAESGWREGFGFVVGEAMAVGTPVVAYAEAALPEVVGDAGLLIPLGDHVGLGTAIIDVLSDSHLAERLAAAGRERARGYDMRIVARRMQEVYRSAAAGG